jgi:hypothetical protein
MCLDVDVACRSISGSWMLGERCVLGDIDWWLEDGYEPEVLLSSGGV